MIEQVGRVVAVDLDAVWVETLRKSTCSNCSANSGCGQGLMDKLGIGARRGYVRALCNLQLAVGDSVIIGVREDHLLRASLLVYLLPLLIFFAFAMFAQWLAFSEPLIIVCGLGGLALAGIVVRWYSRYKAHDPALQPVVLRAMLAGSARLS
ncbi:SoxR reducing system RseC family protein [Pseudomonas sp. LS44]|uniref:SoxR reducing system RseC family protein n=1 Tax=Pseudomonas sp. LS44 TaxID=1357074 RepID=UPI00215A692F|nr:SoxR reducing system RseC family protein [Pseudomonas sp. LS44]UVE18778.1 SoxR reducing system RseC family protein [Pseudomonas sp. LS44]